MLGVGVRSDVKFIRRALLHQIAEIQGNPITIDALADKLGCGYNTILRHRQALKQQGYIDWDARPGQGTGGSIYEVTAKAKNYMKEHSLW